MTTVKDPSSSHGKMWSDTATEDEMLLRTAVRTRRPTPALLTAFAVCCRRRPRAAPRPRSSTKRSSPGSRKTPTPRCAPPLPPPSAAASDSVQLPRQLLQLGARRSHLSTCSRAAPRRRSRASSTTAANSTATTRCALLCRRRRQPAASRPALCSCCCPSACCAVAACRRGAPARTSC